MTVQVLLLFFTAGIVGLSYGIKKKSKLILFAAAIATIVCGLMILAVMILINGMD